MAFTQFDRSLLRIPNVALGISCVLFLCSIGVIFINSSKEDAKVRQAKEDLKSLNSAIEKLARDTKLVPGRLRASLCVQETETYVDSCTAGIQCTDGLFPNWKGPYIDLVPIDPWGTHYFFDPDYVCHKNVTGCEDVPDNSLVRAVVSFGPNKVEAYDDGDNVVLVICRA
jgi:hypothetical protein